MVARPIEPPVQAGRGETSRNKDGWRRRLKERIDRRLKAGQALPTAAVMGVFEASIVPAPMEPLFLPMMAHRRARPFAIAGALTIGNIIGALLIYAVGVWANEALVGQIAAWFGGEAALERGLDILKTSGFFWLLAVAVTPFPFQIGLLAAGAAGIAVPVVVAAVAIGRGARFLFYALLVKAIGHRARAWLERHEMGLFLAGIAMFGILILAAIVAG